VKGPVAEVGWIDPGGGHVRWPTRGGGFLVRLRRSDALKRARAHCGAVPVQVVREWTQDDVDTAYAGDDLSESMRYGLDHYKVESYRHLEFKCARP
jgi:hypothetical protein